MSGSTSEEFEGSGNILAENFSVYAVDLFGFGYSDKPGKYLSIREHMAAVIDFMDTLGITSAYLIGNLVGANICARIAAEYPNRVRGLMLASVAYNTDPDFYPSRRHTSVYAQSPPADDGYHLQEIWAKASRYGESPAVRDARFGYMHLAGPFVEALHWALCEDTGFEDCLPRIKAPTVVIAFGVPPAGPMPEEAAKLISGAKFEVMPDCTPLVTISAPEKFAAVFAKYFG